MKRSILAATVAISLMSAVPSFAQDSNSGSGSPTNKTMSNPYQGLSKSQRYELQWVAANADSSAVKRYKAQGFNEAIIKGAANIAFRAGLDVSYVLNQYRFAGVPLIAQASQYNVPSDVVTKDLPGFGMDFSGPGSGMAGLPGATNSGSMNDSMSTSSMNSGMMKSDRTGAGTMGNAAPPTTSTSSTSAPPATSTSSTSTTSTTTTTATTANTNSDIIAVAQGNPNLSTFVKAVQAAGLVDTLKGTGPFTVFAPTNDAFAKLPADTLNDLLKPENKQKLVGILTYHVVPGRLMAADVMAMNNPATPKTVNGATLNIKTVTPVTINDATVTSTDIAASNGVIHLIDAVLMPPAQ